jgi:hypothetical protein
VRLADARAKHLGGHHVHLVQQHQTPVRACA